MKVHRLSCVSLCKSQKHMVFLKKFLHTTHILPLMIVIVSVLFSCVHIKKPDDSIPKILDEDILKKISVGMTIDEIFHYCEPVVLFEIPIFRYPTKDGLYYVFYFLPTNEANWPAPIQNGEVSLVAVTLHNPKTQKEYYVLPDFLQGEIFTGIKPPNQW